MEATAPTGVSGRDAEKGPGLRVQLTSATEEGWNRAPFGKITGVFGFQPSRQLWDAMWFAEEETPRPAFAESPAYHTLFRELRNYLNGEIPGRSFLVSGHRGAGKTSMVLRAIEDLYDAAADEDPFDDIGQRPLLIRLHGPSLLAAVKTAKDSSSSVGNAAAQNGESIQDSAMADVLSQIMISIYRALSAEVVRCFRRFVQRREFAAGHVGDAVETAGQLSLELDNAPPPNVLREYWRRAGALSQGIFWLDRRDLHQPMRELVAVATAAQAYRVVSGAVTYSEGGKDEATQERNTESAWTLAGKDIADKALGFLAGGLVGGAYWFGHREQVIATAAVGLATAFVSSWTFKYTSKRGKKQTATQEYTFIRKSDVSTLDRELPVVIERIREAGLAPVFMVDELDKVDGLAEAMADLIKRLKHIVADRSFFCFLTDRDYFELLQQKSRRLPYPQEHTYYSQRLFILYRPENLHAYLEQILVSPDSRQAGSRVRKDTSGEPDEIVIFRNLLSYLVMHRAMLHVFDLQRELSKVCDEAGIVTIRLSELFSHYGYRFHIMMQLAVELLLSEDEMRDRLNQDPHFGQLAYDALYFISRQWAEGKNALDLSEEDINAYLAGRIDPDWAEAQWNPEGELPIRNAHDVIAETINETDHAFLIGSIKRMASLLTAPNNFARMLAESRILGKSERILLDLIPGPDRLLLSETAGTLVWQHDYFGRPLITEEKELETRTTTELAKETLALADSLQSISTLLQEVTNREIDFRDLTLFGLLSRSPDWHEVELAAGRLRKATEEGASYDSREMVADENLVREFVSMLRERGPMVLAALTLAGELYKRAELKGGNRFSFGLRAIVVGLQVLKREVHEVSSQLRGLLNSVWPDHPIPKKLETISEFVEMYPLISQWLSKLEIENGSLNSAADDFWSKRDLEVLEAGDWPSFESVTISDLVVLSTDHGFLIREGLMNRTIRGLSAMLASGQVRGASVEDSQVLIPIPEWVFFWAYITLGFGHTVKQLLSNQTALQDVVRLFPRWTSNDANSWLQAVAEKLGNELSEPSDTVIVVSDDNFGAPWQVEAGLAAVEITDRLDDAILPPVRQLLGKTPFTLAVVDTRLIGIRKKANLIKQTLADPSAIVALADEPYDDQGRLEGLSIPVIFRPDSLSQAVGLAHVALQQSTGQNVRPGKRRATPRTSIKRKSVRSSRKK